jgi:hypothetical protein
LSPVHTDRGHGLVHGPCARVTKFATRVHGPCARPVDTVRAHGTPFTLPVFTGRVQQSTRVSISIARQCFLTPVLSTVRGHGSLHGARFTLPVHTARVYGPCAREQNSPLVSTDRAHGPWTRAVFTGNVNGA